MPRIIARNEKETARFAAQFSKTLKGGEVILLQGELGAGKTTFVWALARALGIKTRVTSPTFVLMQVHRVAKSIWHSAKGKKKLRPTPYALRYFVHVDAYRARSAEELREIGLMDFVGRPDTVVLVEWGEKIKPLLRGQKYQVIKFVHGKQQEERMIILQH